MDKLIKSKILSRYEHPILFFNPVEIKKNTEYFLKHFPGNVSWAVKSNPAPEVVKEVFNSGIKFFDVASLKEIELVKSIGSNAQLFFNNPVKSRVEIIESYKNWGIRNFVIDHHNELNKFNQIFNIHDRKNITLQIRLGNTDFKSINDCNFISKFGTNEHEFIYIVNKVLKSGYKISFTFHFGSQNENPKEYSKMLKRIEIILIKNFNISGQYLLNVGGGFPAKYKAHKTNLDDFFYEISNSNNNSLFNLICEPGRAITASSMKLLTKVKLVKENSIYINDGIYGSFKEHLFVKLNLDLKVYNKLGNLKKSVETKKYKIFGPTCDGCDVLPEDYVLPKNISEEDYILFDMMGAYTNASATTFNGFPKAKIISIC